MSKIDDKSYLVILLLYFIVVQVNGFNIRINYLIHFLNIIYSHIMDLFGSYIYSNLYFKVNHLELCIVNNVESNIYYHMIVNAIYKFI